MNNNLELLKSILTFNLLRRNKITSGNNNSDSASCISIHVLHSSLKLNNFIGSMFAFLIVCIYSFATYAIHKYTFFLIAGIVSFLFLLLVYSNILLANKQLNKYEIEILKNANIEEINYTEIQILLLVKYLDTLSLALIIAIATMSVVLYF